MEHGESMVAMRRARRGQAWLKGWALLAWALCALLLAIALGWGLAFADTADSADETEEKYETPTVTKEIGEVTNATSLADDLASGAITWGDAADATVGESVPYRITGTLPSNWDDFETYYYEFHDTQDEAIVVDVESVTVTLCRADGTTEDLTSSFTIVYNETTHVLTATIADLKAAAEDITADDTVVLSYTATLDAALAQAGTGGAAENYVYLQYTSSPETGGIGRTPEDGAELYTWAIDIVKLAGDTGEALAGAAFTLTTEDGRYVCADGTLTEEPVELFVDEDGSLVVSGLDAGTYTVSETTVPEGYVAVADFTVTISADLDGVALSAAVAASSAVALTGVNVGSGTVSLQVTDEEADEDVPVIPWLPQTGDEWGRAIGVLLLVALVAGAVVVAVAKRNAARCRAETQGGD